MTDISLTARNSVILTVSKLIFVTDCSPECPLQTVKWQVCP